MLARDVITRLGGPTQAARTLNLKRTAVQMWPRDAAIPARHALAAARALGVPVEALLDAASAPQPEPMDRAA